MGGEREGEKHWCVVASHVPPTGDLARSPGMCPDWELNQRPFGSQAGSQSTEPHQPGQFLFIFRKRVREGERETLMWERNMYRLPLLCTLTWDWTHTKACMLNGDRTCNLLLCMMMPNQLSHTCQARNIILEKYLLSNYQSANDYFIFLPSLSEFKIIRLPCMSI